MILECVSGSAARPHQHRFMQILLLLRRKVEAELQAQIKSIIIYNCKGHFTLESKISCREECISIRINEDMRKIRGDTM